MPTPPEGHDIDIDDLQAAIDASAHATVQRKSTKQVKATEESQTPAAVPEPSQTKPDKPKQSAEKAQPVAVTVNTPKQEKVEQPAEKPAGAQPVAVKIKQTSTIMPEKPKADPDATTEPTREPTMAHRGKDLQPISESDAAATESAAKSEAPAAETSEEMSVKVVTTESVKTKKPEIKPIEKPASQPDKPASPEEVSIKIEGLQQTNLKKEAEAAKKTKDEEFDEEGKPTKIYDTKEYHLPIKANRHHKKGTLPNWVSVVVLLALLAGSAAYAYFTTDIFG